MANYNFEDTWDEFYAEGTYLMWVPDECLVQFVAKEIERKKKKIGRILDLGCGNGRHLVYLSKKGFNAYGIDISQKSLQIAQDWLNKKGLQTELKKASVTEIPYPDEYFDIVICMGMLDHILIQEVKKGIQEIERVLTPEGIFFLGLRSDRDTECGKGEEIERNTFLLPGDVEGNLPQHFFNLIEIKELLVNFKITNLECRERLMGMELSDINSRWIITAQKLLND
ncbi:MAG: class I SAM-dependent methyltransferase [bacterium]|nr:class I SAM-dependent methyltransferase [bacterium]